MHAGAVISYAEDPGQPRAEVTLPNRDHVLLTLDRDGLAITRLAGPEHLAEVLFQADANVVSRICAGLYSLETMPKPTPLRILVAAIVQFASAEDVRKAFREVAVTLR
jgi:hypothetical protein